MKPKEKKAKVVVDKNGYAVEILAENGVKIEILSKGQRVVVSGVKTHLLEDMTDIRFNEDGTQSYTWIYRGWDKVKTKVKTWTNYGLKNRRVNVFGSYEHEKKRVMFADEELRDY